MQGNISLHESRERRPRFWADVDIADHADIRGARPRQLQQVKQHVAPAVGFHGRQPLVQGTAENAVARDERHGLDSEPMEVFINPARPLGRQAGQRLRIKIVAGAQAGKVRPQPLQLRDFCLRERARVEYHLKPVGQPGDFLQGKAIVHPDAADGKIGELVNRLQPQQPERARADVNHQGNPAAFAQIQQVPDLCAHVPAGLLRDMQGSERKGNSGLPGFLNNRAVFLRPRAKIKGNAVLFHLKIPLTFFSIDLIDAVFVDPEEIGHDKSAHIGGDHADKERQLLARHHEQKPEQPGNALRDRAEVEQRSADAAEARTQARRHERFAERERHGVHHRLADAQDADRQAVAGDSPELFVLCFKVKGKVNCLTL